MGIRAHLLPTGDEAGPAPALYALNGVDLKATFIVQGRELPLGIHPPAWALYYYPEFAFNLLDVRDRLEFIDGDLRITDAVPVHLLGGHSPGTQVVLLETHAGRVCLPGDLVPFYKNIELNWPMGAFFDLEGVMKAYAWMLSHADIIVPHHGWGLFARHMDGTLGVTEMAAALQSKAATP